MPDIEKFVYDSTTYDIADASARSSVENLDERISYLQCDVAKLENKQVGEAWFDCDGYSRGEIFNNYANNIASGDYSHAEGNHTTASGDYSHAEGAYTTASESNSHASGYYTTASGASSYAEGYRTTASGDTSHAEGYRTTASGTYSHASGYYTTASGDTSHAEGYRTTASESASHAEGISTTASGNTSHAEGISTTASGNTSHAEGYYTTASGVYSHAEGYTTQATGDNSHAGGSHTIASSDNSTVIGQYNQPDTWVRKEMYGASDSTSGVLISSDGSLVSSTAENCYTTKYIYIGDSDSINISGYYYIEPQAGDLECRWIFCQTNSDVSNTYYGYGVKQEQYGSDIDPTVDPVSFSQNITITDTIRNSYPYLRVSAQVTASPSRRITIEKTTVYSATPHLFLIGNGEPHYSGPDVLSNIVEVSATEMNVNGDIKQNNNFIVVQYSTMPTIDESIIGHIVQYTGTTSANYTKGWFYEAVSDGAQEPTYSWQAVNSSEGSGGGCTYRGTTTTAISNGSTTNPITIDGESYTAVFGDVVVYNYTEFVFDGTTWSEFGRPFDTTPTSGSANAVTSDGVYRNTAGQKYYVDNVYKGEVFNNCEKNVASGTYSHAEGNYTTASGTYSHAEGNHTTASGAVSHAEGYYTTATKLGSTAIGKYNVADTDVTHLLIVGNGTDEQNRSNILEVSETDVNVNGDIKKNGISLPTPYTTMPVITSNMLGQVAQYVGTTDANFTKGYFYIASSDGAAEPTYSWVNLLDTVPTQDSANAVTSDGVYRNTAGMREFVNNTLKGEIFNVYSGSNKNVASGAASHAEGQKTMASDDWAHAEGRETTASGKYSHAEGGYTIASGSYSHAGGIQTIASELAMTAIGARNSPQTGDLFEIGNGTSTSARSNIVEVNASRLNVNGDIQRNGVGIDDYTTTERKIGKWIDGSDLYQRTFEVTGLHNDGTYDDNILGTSNIVIRDWTGYLQYDIGTGKQHFPIYGYWANTTDWIGSWTTAGCNDLSIHAKLETRTYTLDKAVITIKYTKPSVQANIQQTEEPTDEMR